jgi:ATP phosphoribosyltransferase
MLTIALSKGRILDDTLPLLAEAGIVPTENPDKSRKLIIPTTQDDVRLLIVRATDVPTYVEHGAADLGVAGKDVLMEYTGQGLYEPLDLQIAQCKLMTAGKIGAPSPRAVCAWRPSSSTLPSVTTPSRAVRSTSSSSTARWNWRR